MKLKNKIYRLGEKGFEFFTSIFDVFFLLYTTVKSIPKLWFYRRQVLEQLYNFSVNTLPLVTIISIFVGLVATIQATYQTTDIVPRYFVVNVIFKSTILELSPVILALILAGKIGASIAAEIGSMKITEQIEALETLSLEPEAFLVLPRVLASVIMLPILTTFANLFAMISAYVISCVVVQWVQPFEFLNGLKLDFRPFEIYFGSLIKPSIFGGIIALIGCYFGLKTEGGARGVGHSATNAVVVAAVLIVILDYYLGELFL